MTTAYRTKWPTVSAEQWWGHVQEVARRIKVDQDATAHGINWAERAETPSRKGQGPSYSEELLWLDVQKALEYLECVHEYACLFIRHSLDNCMAGKGEWSSESPRLRELGFRMSYECRREASGWGRELVYRLSKGDGSIPDYPHDHGCGPTFVERGC